MVLLHSTVNRGTNAVFKGEDRGFPETKRISWKIDMEAALDVSRQIAVPIPRKMIKATS